MNILRVLFRKCFSIWQHTRQVISWKLQYSKCIKAGLVKGCHHSVQYFNLKKILILSPHADDEWIGCSSLITSGICEVDVLYYQLYGYNQSERNKSIRDHEILDCSKDNHYTLITSTNPSDKLKELLLSNNYDAVFSPSPIDWHWEHRYVFDTLAKVFSEIKDRLDINVFLYFISVPPIKYSNVYSSSYDKTYQVNKWSYFNKRYASQKMPNIRYKLQERLNAINSGQYAAELFEYLTEQKINELHKYIHLESSSSYLNTLSKEINDIYHIRQICKRLNHERETK